MINEFSRKESPLQGLTGLGGGLGYLALKGELQPTSFLVFGGASASFNDQVGSLDFSNAGGQMTLSSTTHGGPPGFTNSGLIAGGSGNNTSNVRTADDVIPDLSGDFTIDCCSYNAAVVNSSSSMMWSVGNYSKGSSWYIYNATGDSRFDTANTSWSGRLGEGGPSTLVNYTQNKWCVSRLRRSGNTTFVSWYEENSGGNGWDLKGEYSATTSGEGPNISNSSGGRMILNGWAASHGSSGNYQIGSSQVSIAWIRVYDSSFTDTPYVG
tara:strand:- start:96 stop:899 length:804 start_codon:yes stop_codon:yes gene_type:complete